MRRSAAAVVASNLVAATLAGCADADPAEPYARQGCEARERLEYDDTNGGGAAPFRTAAEYINDSVRAPLASAAKRDDAYAEAHTAAVELSRAMSEAASVLDAGTPSDSEAARLKEAFLALSAACEVVLAD